MDTSKMNDSVTNINNLGFDDVWSGSAYEAQREQLTSTMDKLNKCIEDLNKFDIILQKRDEYVEICTKIANLSKQKASCEQSHNEETIEKGCGNCSSLSAQIKALEIKRLELREIIIAMLAEFVGIDAEIAPPADLTAIGDDILTFEEQKALSEIYMAMPPGNIAENLEGKVEENGVVIEDGYAYIQQRIDEIKSKYTGPERNYYVAMEVIELSILAGVRSPYEHNGTACKPGMEPSEATRAPVDTKWLSLGIDCNAFASMVIFDDESLQGWLEVKQFPEAQPVLTFDEAQPGDIFCNGGHVGKIMSNNPETGEVIICHASSHNNDMKYEVVTYEEFESQGYSVRRIDRTYESSRLRKKLENENQ